jgi:hypothetical protein
MKLVMLTLDGPDAKENRNRIATLLQFNIAGDERVIPVLEQNASPPLPWPRPPLSAISSSHCLSPAGPCGARASGRAAARRLERGTPAADSMRASRIRSRVRIRVDSTGGGPAGGPDGRADSDGRGGSDVRRDVRRPR